MRLIVQPEEKGAGGRLPIGLPRLPEPGDSVHIGILQEWLVDCDRSHTCVPSEHKSYCPRRLIEVGRGGLKPSCNVVETKNLTEEERNELKYIALSHPWGNVASDPTNRKHFKSTKSKLLEYCDRILDSDLPANFQHALNVTRQLGINYLWIDSICILQEGDGDKGDFLEEAQHMQDIFSSAYCVLAASSAEGMWSGFLEERQDSSVVALPPRSFSDGGLLQYYVSEVTDDFQRDVIEAPLNQRGWVLQERALARRTIHFTNNQTYWECGRGIRCETLSSLVRYV
jgi:hypothetical protein